MLLVTSFYNGLVFCLKCKKNMHLDVFFNLYLFHVQRNFSFVDDRFVSFFRSVFFGDVSPKDKPEFYIQCIQYVYQAYADNYKNRIPLVVNTQGWVRGKWDVNTFILTHSKSSKRNFQKSETNVHAIPGLS